MLYNILLNAHSGLRWVVLLLIIVTIINAAQGMNSRRMISLRDKRLSLVSLSFVHLQVVIGLVLYFISPRVQFSASTMSNKMLRFFTVEHLVGMLIAVILVTIGHRKSKSGSLKEVFWYYVIALIVMLVTIPWPFRGLGSGWF
jgi:hypothetical protein